MLTLVERPMASQPGWRGVVPAGRRRAAIVLPLHAASGRCFHAGVVPGGTAHHTAALISDTALALWREPWTGRHHGRHIGGVPQDSSP